jgi:hypothetical protein
MGTIQGIQEESMASRHLLIYPNPASETTTISFVVETPGYFTLTLFDEKGGSLAPPHQTYCSKGIQKIIVSLKGIPPGVYFCEVKQGSDRVLGKIIVF